MGAFECACLPKEIRDPRTLVVDLSQDNSDSKMNLNNQTSKFHFEGGSSNNGSNNQNNERRQEFY